MDLKELGEFGLIERLRRRPEVVGIGDDAAVVPFGGKTLLVTTDALVENVHFRLETTSPGDLGYKAMAANLSDIAAMGGIPGGAVVSLALPRETDVELVDALYDGLAEVARAHSFEIKGGDLTTSPGPLMISITLWGEPAGPSPILRSGAAPGDIVFISGHPGESSLGLRLLERGETIKDDDEMAFVEVHRRPRVNLPLGSFLGRHGLPSAMIDTSDGLLLDLSHIAEESGVGTCLDIDRLPLSPGMIKTARALGLEPFSLALSGGEDYLLLFTVPPYRRDEILNLVSEKGLGPAHAIGEIESEKGLRIRKADGTVRGMKASGWDHFGPSTD